MKTLRKYLYTPIALLLSVTALVSCHNDMPKPESKEGVFALILNVEDIKTEVETRASLEGIDISTFCVYLTDTKGNSWLEEVTYGSLTEKDCILPIGEDYNIYIESCSETDATELNDGFGIYRFVGETVFDVEAGKTTPVSVNCSMANAGVKFEFEESFTNKFPIHAVTTLDSRSLVFKKDNQENVAYYNMDDETKEVEISLSGSSGGWDDRLNVARNVTLQKGKVIVVKLTYNESNGVRMFNI